METLFALLASPGMLLGTLVGVALAALFHWLAPAGTDTTTAGALMIFVTAVAGLAYEVFFRGGNK